MLMMMIVINILLRHSFVRPPMYITLTMFFIFIKCFTFNRVDLHCRIGLESNQDHGATSYCFIVSGWANVRHISFFMRWSGCSDSDRWITCSFSCCCHEQRRRLQITHACMLMIQLNHAQLCEQNYERVKMQAWFSKRKRSLQNYIEF